MHKPLTPMIKSSADDPNWQLNKTYLESTLGKDAKVIAYRLYKKNYDEKFSTKDLSRWLVIWYKVGEECFKTRRSYAANQYLKIKYEVKR